MAANTLTNLVPTIHTALDMVAREQVGYIMAVRRNSEAEIAAVGETIQYPVVPALSAADITPAAYAPDNTAVTVGTKTMTISKSRVVNFGFTGEEQRGLRNSTPGNNYDAIYRALFAQAFRTICNEVEADLAALYKEASRAYGTAATAPFGTAGDLSDIAQIRRILADNGTPLTDLHLVLSSAAAANMRGKQSSLFKANEAASEAMLRQGALEQLQGFMIHESAYAASHTKGTGTSYQINNGAGYAVGSTTIAVDTGSGTIVAGDVLTNSQSGVDANNKYVVNTALSAGSLVLNKPGNRVAWADDNTVAVGNSYTANLAFHRDAIQLVARQPLMPDGGDGASDVINVADPVTGLIFQIAMYGQYRQRRIDIGLAWGVEAVKSEFMAILLG